MHNLSLLLVEDNADDEWLALRALKKLGIERPAVARDGSSAISLLSGNGGQGEAYLPDLVLLDLKLPKMDGIEVLRRMRDDPVTSAINVVLLTSSEDPKVFDTCRSMGVLACLQKPLSANSLLPILQALPATGWPPIENRSPAAPAARPTC